MMLDFGRDWTLNILNCDVAGIGKPVLDQLEILDQLISWRISMDFWLCHSSQSAMAPRKLCVG